MLLCTRHYKSAFAVALANCLHSWALSLQTENGLAEPECATAHLLKALCDFGNGVETRCSIKPVVRLTRLI